jgi:acyl dehydratase
MVVTGFEQFTVGQVFKSGSQVVDAAAIKGFARQFDSQPQHIGEDAARGSVFGVLVASGWHTASVTMRLLLASALAGVGGRGMGVRMDNLIWPAPVYPGDSLHTVTEITELRPSRSKPDRGLVVMHTTTRNQDGVAVQELQSTIMVLRSDAVIQPRP